MRQIVWLFVLLLPQIAMGTDDPLGYTDRDLRPEAVGDDSRSYALAGWQEELLLSWNDGHESINPRPAADESGVIHVVWKDNAHAYNEILYRSGGGTSWGDITTVSHPDTNSNSPWVAVDGSGNVHVVYLRWTGIPWGDYDLGYRKYNQALGMWEEIERLTYIEAIDSSGRPQILCDSNGVVYVFWLQVQKLPHMIWCIKNDGFGWAPRQPVTGLGDDPNGYYGTTIAPDNTIHCVWQDYRSGTPELYQSRYDGVSWSGSMPVTSNGFSSVYPRIAPDASNNIHLVYGGGPSLNQKIHVLAWDASSETWGPETVFPNQWALPHVDMDVDLDNSDVHLTYSDFISGNCEIMYRHYDAGAGSWEDAVQLTDGHPDLRLDPQVCLDPNGSAHAVWYDYRHLIDHQEEIYYTTDMTAVGVEETPLSAGSPLDVKVSPNPFIGETEISFDFGAARGPVELAIYDVGGRLISNLGLIDSSDPGKGKGTWDGRDREGRPCRAGIYLVKARQKDGVSVSRAVKLE